MGVIVFSGILPEELFGKGFRKEFHGHGVDFAGLKAWPNALIGHPISVQVSGKGVACLMGNHLNIMLGTVKVGKDERCLVVLEGGAISPTLLALGGEQIH